MARRIRKIRFKSIRQIFYGYKFINHKRFELSWRFPANMSEGEYKPKESQSLSRSCLFDPVIFQSWGAPLPENRRIKPNQKPQESSLTRELLDNVYARSLSEPVRAELISSIPVPRFVLQRFGAFVPPISDGEANSQTIRPWLLPVVSDLQSPPTGKGAYFVLDKGIIQKYTKSGLWKGGYARLNRLKRWIEIERVNHQSSSKDKKSLFPIWRADMDEFLHRELIQALFAYIDNDKLLGKLQLVQQPLQELSRDVGQASAILTFAPPPQQDKIVTFKREPINGAPIPVYHIRQFLPLIYIERILDRVQQEQKEIIVLSKSCNNHFLQLLLKIAIYHGDFFSAAR